jgi:hypothetical protein
VQPHSKGRCTAGLPPPCAGLPGDVLAPPSARQRARTAAAPSLTSLPPSGLKKNGASAAALCPCRWFSSLPNPLVLGLRRSLPAPARSWGSAPRRPGRPFNTGIGLPQCDGSLGLHLPRGCRSFPCNTSQCNATGLRRQGLASVRAPAGVLPQSDRQRGHEGVLGGPWCWRTAVTDLGVPGDRRRIRVSDAVRARAGGPRGGNVSPHPSRVAALRGWTNGL